MNAVLKDDRRSELKNGIDDTIIQNIYKSFSCASFFQFNQSLSLDGISRSDIKSADYIEMLLIDGKITLSDMYIIEAVGFFGHADLQMVISRLKYLKMQFPHKPIVTEREGVSTRLQQLGKYGLLWRRRFKSEEAGWINIYTITYRGFKLYSDRLDKSFHYDNMFVSHYVTKILRHVHVGEVTCILQDNFRKHAELLEWRHGTYALKTEKGKYYPSGYMKFKYEDNVYNFIIESAHFNVDERVETEEERHEKFLEQLSNMVKVKDSFTAKYENTIFIFCVEDFNAVKKLIAALELFKDELNGISYITSERVLKENKGLNNACLRAQVLNGSMTVTICNKPEWFLQA